MRTVQVPRERVPRWIEGYADRHGAVVWTAEDAAGVVRGAAEDGAVAEIMINTGPLEPGEQPGALLRQLAVDRVVGILLVRKGGHAVGVLRGETVLDHTAGTSYVQGRTKKGGWSQQRYARRRGHQADRAYAKAADDAARLLTGRVDPLNPLTRLVCGGDRQAVEAVLDDPRLSGLRPIWDGRVFGVAEPRYAVLLGFVPVALGVTIRLDDVATDPVTAPTG